MSVGIGLKICCLECSRPRLELVEIKRGIFDSIFDRDVNVYCECSDICRAYAVDEGDVVSVQNCDRDALLELADEIDRKSNDGTVNPDPMKPIASSLDLFGYARRIREALGVDE